MVVITVLLLLSIIGALRSLPQTHEATQHILNHIDWFWLGLSCVSMSFAFICMAARWRALMPETLKPPLHELTGLICAGLLLNYAAPGPVGELGAAWFAHKRYPISLEDSLASGISARLLGLMTTAILGVVIWLLFELPVAEEHKPLIQSSALLIGCGEYWSHSWRPSQCGGRPFYKARRPLSARYAPKPLKRRRPVTTALIQVLNHHPMRYARAVFWSTGAHTSVTFGIVLAAIALKTDYNLAGLAFTYTITTAAAVLLFAFPGSYLGWDALFLGLLITTAGINPPEAAAIALIVRLQQIVYMGLGGFSLDGWLRD